MNVISTDFYKSNVWMIYYDFWPKMVVSRIYTNRKVFWAFGFLADWWNRIIHLDYWAARVKYLTASYIYVSIRSPAG